MKTVMNTNSNSGEGETGGICYFCHNRYDPTISEKIFSKDSIHRSCCRHLKPEHLTETFLSWNDTMSLPFCKKCLFCAQKLSRMNDKLEEIHKKIERFVNNFTVEFLNSRRNIFTSKSISESKDCGTDGITSDFVIADGGDLIKLEQPDTDEICLESQLSMCGLEDIYSGYASSEDGQIPIVETKQELANKSVVRRGRGRPRSTTSRKPVKSKEHQNMFPNFELKSVRVNITRIEFDVNGKPIIVEEPLPRRKAAIKAEATFSSWVEELTGRSKHKRAPEAQVFDENDENENMSNELTDKTVGSKIVSKSKRRKFLRREMNKSSTNKKVASALKCKLCGTMFSTNSKLKIHMNTHKEGRPFTCIECNFPFKSRDSLRRHQESHSNIRMFKCPHCDKSYKYRRNLKDHIKALGHHEDSNVNCELCVKAFYRKKKVQYKTEDIGVNNTQPQFSSDDVECQPTGSRDSGQDSECAQPNENVSKKRIRGKAGNYVCEHCGKICASPYKLKMHTRTHTGEKTISCEHCEKRFYDQHDAKRHKETHFAERTYKCDHCEKCYKYQRNVKEHIIKHHPERVHLLEEKEALENGKKVRTSTRSPKKKEKKDKYSCTDCDQTFSDKVTLHCHKYSHEPEGTEITCYDCNAKLADLIDLQQHVLIHNEERKFLCSFCGDQFKNQTSQTEHEILHYNLDENEIKEKYFPCSECPKIFVSSIRLKNHFTVHCKERPYGPCEVCGATFKTIHIFKSHQRIHHVDRTKFQCSICSKLFSSRGCLNKHMYLHSEEKLFLCFCGKRFSTRSGLTAHSVYHRTDRPYLCEECGQGFYTGTKLREHYRIHTGMLLHCEFCPKGFKNSTLLKQHHQVHDKSLVPNRPKRVRKSGPTVKRQRKSSHKPRSEAIQVKVVKKEEEVAAELIENILQFQCSICDEWFEGEDDINQHMEIHNDVSVQDSIIVM